MMATEGYSLAENRPNGSPEILAQGSTTDEEHDKGHDRIQDVDDDDSIDNSSGGDFVPPPTSWFDQPYDFGEKTTAVDEDEHDGDDDERSHENSRQEALGITTTTNMQQQLHDNTSPHHHHHHQPIVAAAVLAHPRPSPSWNEISSQVLPAAARELLSSSLRKMYDTARLSYSKGRWHRKYSDMGNVLVGVSRHGMPRLPGHLTEELPPCSGLPWIDRQLVREWRSYLPEENSTTTIMQRDVYDDDLEDFERARTLVPNVLPRPTWQKSDVCFACHQPFGPTRLRHHCRSCGRSFCHPHSSCTQRLPHLGYEDIAERVCDVCKRTLEEQNLAERVAWRLARCRDYSDQNLTPYFETGLDSVEEVAIRVTKAALAMAKSIPLGAQATVAVETVDVLRKYGLHGIYGIMLRQEFLAAADLLRKALGINKSSWPLSVHELSAAIFYALAQHRAMRGLNPEREHIIHRYRRNDVVDGTMSSVPTWTETASPVLGATDADDDFKDIRTPDHGPVPRVIDSYELSALDFHSTPVIDQTDIYDPDFSSTVQTGTDETLQNVSFSTPDPRRPVPRGDEEIPTEPQSPSFTPVCDPVSDADIASLLFYAPIALNFVYAEKEVDMQLLAAQQGWRLLYAYLTQDLENVKPADRPASALFIHQEHKIACLSIRGTATINDVITDIRQIPVPFPDMDPEHGLDKHDEDWTNVFHGQGVALCGMAAAAVNLFREHIDSILYFAQHGYRIRLVGHSLGGGVATLMGMLILKHLELIPKLSENVSSTQEETALLKVYAYGTPSCLDASLASSVDSFVTTVVLHDDVFPRLTPTSCRGLLKHLLHIRETWVKTHMEEDLRAVSDRARTAWAPRFRHNFAMRTSSTSSIKKYCKKQIQKGKKKLQSVKDKAIGRPPTERMDNTALNDSVLDSSESGIDAVADVESIASSSPSEWGEKFFVPAAEVSVTESFDSAREESERSEDDTEGQQTPLLLEILGGGDTEAAGLVVDGDEFFEPEESLLEGSDSGSESLEADLFGDPLSGSGVENQSLNPSDSWSLDMQGRDGPPEKKETDDENVVSAIVVEESPLPRMFIPGKVIHVYSHRGVYKAAYVPRTFRELRRISLAGNMLTNHTSKSYYEGLLEVQTARAAPEAPPKWSAFDEDDTCCCCANRFTWASTCNSEAQEARDKHNCRSCGGLVCDPCAKNRVPIPSIGLTVPVRTCDRCYNNIMGGVSAASSVTTGSFSGVDDLSDSIQGRDKGVDQRGTVDENEKRPERRRQKRSVVVDDLVSQMRSSALTYH
jgi:hypothetical protein